MGSSHSAPKLKQKFTAPDANAPDQLPKPVLSEAEPVTTLNYDLNLILKMVESIPRASPSYAISCFSQFSVPLVNSFIKLDDFPDLKVKFAKIAIVRYEFGRVICFGHISFLTACIPTNKKFTLFVQKVLRWVGGPHPTTRMLCLYKIDPQYHRVLKSNLEGLGFGIEITDKIENIMEYTIILVQTSCSDDPRFINFLNNGGGIIVCGVENEKIQINDTLRQIGLCFIDRNIEFVDDELMEDIIPEKKYETLEKGSLDEHIKVLNKILYERETYSSIIPKFTDIVLDELLYSSSYSYRQTTDIMENLAHLLVSNSRSSEIGNDELSVILFRIAGKIFQYVPPTFWNEIDLSNGFIGESQNAECDEVSMNGLFSNAGWLDTGIWIQPRYVNTITFDKRIPDCDIVIGAHTFVCTENEAPWKRLPFASLRFPVTDKIMNIVTPFGGMVFFDPHKSEILAEKKLSFRASFSDASKFPVASLNNSNLWKQTYTSDIPWGEMITKYTCIIAQTEHINAIDNQIDQMNWIDKIIDALFSCSNYEFQYRFRIVFDIEFPNDLCKMYPITINSAFCSKIIRSKVPSQEIFFFCVILAYNTFIEYGISHELHSIIAITIGFLTFQTVYNAKEAVKCNTFTNHGAKELIEVASENRDNFRTAILDLRNAQKNLSLECDKVFIESLKKSSGFDLSKVLNNNHKE